VERATISKAPGAKGNTYQTVVKGLRSFHTAARESYCEANILVIFTSDGSGESLSVSHGDSQWAMPFEAIEKLIEHTRKNK
jgi:hypothetical protein